MHLSYSFNFAGPHSHVTAWPFNEYSFDPQPRVVAQVKIGFVGETRWATQPDTLMMITVCLYTEITALKFSVVIAD
jgi:hypothetical protein